MKKIFFTLIILTLVSLGVQTNASGYMYVPRKPLLEEPQYKNVTLDNIKSVKILRYTEDGIKEKNIENKAEIGNLYNYLKQIDIYSETRCACEDNSTVYVFSLNDGTKEAIEFECEWVVIKGKHYFFEFRDVAKNSKILY